MSANRRYIGLQKEPRREKFDGPGVGTVWSEGEQAAGTAVPSGKGFKFGFGGKDGHKAPEKALKWRVSSPEARNRAKFFRLAKPAIDEPQRYVVLVG